MIDQTSIGDTDPPFCAHSEHVWFRRDSPDAPG
jgi:hypothetical protein